MATHKAKACAGCDKISLIRTDRQYCSVACANKSIAAQKKAWTKIIVAGDIHIPFHDKDTVQLFYEFVQREMPDTLVLNGDILDMYEISSFLRDPSRKAALANEFEQLHDFLGNLRYMLPKTRIIYVCGNHEHRFHKYIVKNAKELVGLPGLSFVEQAQLEKFNVEYIPCDADRFIDTYVDLGGFLVGHFTRLSIHSAYAAKALLDDYGTSLIQAHVHSMGVSHKTLHEGIVGGWEGGCLCTLEPHFMKQKKWMQGWTVVHKEVDGSFFHVEQVPVINHSYFYGGKLWK